MSDHAFPVVPDFSDSPTLTAENLRFRYQKRGRDVLHDVSLTLPPGTLTVLLGPNASGKSTLIKCLAGIQRPHSGTVRVGGADVTRLSAREIATRIAYAPQSVTVPFAFTIRELLDLGSTTPAASSPTRDALETFELTGMLDRSLLSLSGGERQRALAARSFAQNTLILLLDEPTAHLDLRHQIRLMEAARQRARQGGAVCVVLHDLNLAATFADSIVLLQAGKVAASGSVSEVLQLPVLDSVYQAAIHVIDGPDGKPIVLPFTQNSHSEAVQDLTVS